MKILITGGAGFLGSYLSESLLSRGYDVVAMDMVQNVKNCKISHLLDNEKFKFYRGSVLDKDLMDKLIWECDKVFHFAALVGVHHYVERPYDVLDVNINGTKLVLDLAHKYGKKVVFASTSEIYGKNTKVPFSENDDRLLGPTKIDRWSYSTSKAAGEHYCFAYHQMGLEVVVLRFFNAYGPRLDSIESGRIISIFMGQLLKGKPLTIIGDGSQTRCFTYVDDIVDGIVSASEVKEAEGEVINIGTSRETSILELAEAMIKIYGSDAKIEFIEHEGKYGTGYEDIQRRVPDTAKAKRLLKWEPTISLEEGLATTVQWFKESYQATIDAEKSHQQLSILPKMSQISLSLWAWALNEEALVEKFVKESIQDLEVVTTDYEIILVDDGSTDRTWEIMQDMSQKYPQVKIAKHEKNLRPGLCMHTCLKLTTKEVVFWNTVDSFFDTKTLQEWVEELKDCDMLQGIRTDLVANTPYRKLTHLVNYGLIRFMFQLNIREFQNVKFCKTSFLKKVGLESGSTFTNAECSIKAFWTGHTIKEKSMQFLKRPAGKAKGANPMGILETLRDVFYFWVRWGLLKKINGTIKKGKVIKLDGSIWPRS